MQEHHRQTPLDVNPNRSDGEIDPVCGMKVKPDMLNTVEYQGRTYRFCSPGCREKFKADPEHYLGQEAHDAHGATDHPSALAASSTDPEPAYRHVYTCPMHPEVRQQGPGTCPKCGMALEPVEPRPTPIFREPERPLDGADLNSRFGLCEHHLRESEHDRLENL